MNYIKIYDSLVQRGKNRKLNCYKERHHIIPKCIGGTDDKTNLVDLTPEEHYVAHQLLTKIYPDNIKLVRAACMMIPNRPSNKLYGWIRRRLSTVQSISYKGKGNSQFNTKWVFHEMFGPKKIDCNLIEEYLQQGWFSGRKHKIDHVKKTRVYVTDEERKQNEILYREYYKLYNTYGFEKFVEITNYKYSQANLVQRFSKLLPEFVPQNGKKR
jgi:hypothetical protein